VNSVTRTATAALVVSMLACAASMRAPAAEATAQGAGEGIEPPTVGDAIPAALAAGGNAARGRALIVARGDANCVLCHAIPDPALGVHGDVGPSLAGVGGRLSVGQLRLRIVDMQKVNPASAMPSYYRTQGLDRVADEYRQRPILDATQVEDIVAYLAGLK